MNTGARLLSRLLAAACVTIAAGGAPRADIIRTSDVCANQCLVFTANGGLAAARSISFTAPGRGTALVTFHGSLYCQSHRTDITSLFLATQIVEGNDVVNQNGAGALSIGLTTEVGGSVSHNLASTRVFNIQQAGSHIYRLKIARLGPMPSDITCGIFNGFLNIHFVN